MLVSSHIFLIHTIDVIFVWVGKGASHEEKNHAVSSALKYIPLNKVVNPAVQKVLEGNESYGFMNCFYYWPARQEATKIIKVKLLFCINFDLITYACRIDQVLSCGCCCSFDEILSRAYECTFPLPNQQS
jgi:Gelsolin repeat